MNELIKYFNPGSINMNFSTGRRNETYSQYGYKAKWKGVCKVCGKKMQRTETFTQTINPWNKKTSEEIYNEEKTKAENWLSIPKRCGDCIKNNRNEI